MRVFHRSVKQYFEHSKTTFDIINNQLALCLHKLYRAFIGAPLTTIEICWKVKWTYSFASSFHLDLSLETPRPPALMSHLKDDPIKINVYFDREANLTVTNIWDLFAVQQTPIRWLSRKPKQLSSVINYLDRKGSASPMKTNLSLPLVSFFSKLFSLVSFFAKLLH